MAFRFATFRSAHNHLLLLIVHSMRFVCSCSVTVLDLFVLLQSFALRKRLLRMPNCVRLRQSQSSPNENAFDSKFGFSSCASSDSSENYIEKALTLSFCLKFSWTDSTTVLQWLKPASKLSVFVASRVAEVLESTSSDQWFHALVVTALLTSEPDLLQQKS